MKISKKLVALGLCTMLSVSGTCNAGFMDRGDDGQNALQFYLSVGLTKKDLCTIYALCSLHKFATSFNKSDNSTDINDIDVPKTQNIGYTIDTYQNRLIDIYKIAKQNDLSRFSEYIRINLDKIQEHASVLREHANAQVERTTSIRKVSNPKLYTLNFECDFVFRQLRSQFGKEAGLNTLVGVAKCFSAHFNVKLPRDAKRSLSPLLEWFYCNWCQVSPLLPFVCKDVSDGHWYLSAPAPAATRLVASSLNLSPFVLYPYIHSPVPLPFALPTTYSHPSN